MLQCLPLCRHANSDIGEVARLRAEGVVPQPRSGFSVSLKAENFVRLQCCSYPNPSAYGTSPIRAPRGRGGHCVFANFAVLSTLNHF